MNKLSLLYAVLFSYLWLSVYNYEIIVDCQICKSSICPTQMCLVYNGVGFKNQEYCHNKISCDGYPKPIYSKQCRQSSATIVCNTGCCVQDPNSLKCTDSLQGSQQYCPEKITKQYGFVILMVSLTVAIVTIICCCGCIFIKYKFFNDKKQQKKQKSKCANEYENQISNTQTKLRRGQMISQPYISQQNTIGEKKHDKEYTLDKSFNMTEEPNNAKIQRIEQEHHINDQKIDKVQQVNHSSNQKTNKFEQELHNNDQKNGQLYKQKVFTFQKAEDQVQVCNKQQKDTDIKQQISFTKRTNKNKRSQIYDLSIKSKTQEQMCEQITQQQYYFQSIESNKDQQSVQSEE